MTSMACRVLTYNVQAPFLPTEDPRPGETKAERLRAVDNRKRFVFRLIRNTLQGFSKVPTFVCLQEVCEEWKDFLTAELGGFDFSFICHNYSPPQYLTPVYLMLFYKPALFDCQRMPLVFTGLVTKVQRSRLSVEESEINSKKRNAVLAATFTLRGTNQKIVVGTYHAPCMFKYQDSQRVHTENALNVLASSDVPAILAGDFNILPSDPAYKDTDAAAHDAMHMLLQDKAHLPTACSPRMPPGCLDYVFVKGVVPTSCGVHGFIRSTVLSESQPSDHGLLQVVCDLKET